VVLFYSVINEIAYLAVLSNLIFGTTSILALICAFDSAELNYLSAFDLRNNYDIYDFTLCFTLG